MGGGRQCEETERREVERGRKEGEGGGMRWQGIRREGGERYVHAKFVLYTVLWQFSSP